MFPKERKNTNKKEIGQKGKRRRNKREKEEKEETR